MKSKTEGKQLGKIAFYISELIVFVMIGMIIIYSTYTQNIDTNLVNGLLLFQGTIFSVTWGAKASSNFTKHHDRGAE